MPPLALTLVISAVLTALAYLLLSAFTENLPRSKRLGFTAAFAIVAFGISHLMSASIETQKREDEAARNQQAQLELEARNLASSTSSDYSRGKKLVENQVKPEVASIYLTKFHGRAINDLRAGIIAVCADGPEEFDRKVDELTDLAHQYDISSPATNEVIAQAFGTESGHRFEKLSDAVSAIGRFAKAEDCLKRVFGAPLPDQAQRLGADWASKLQKLTVELEPRDVSTLESLAAALRVRSVHPVSGGFWQAITTQASLPLGRAFALAAEQVASHPQTDTLADLKSDLETAEIFSETSAKLLATSAPRQAAEMAKLAANVRARIPSDDALNDESLRQNVGAIQRSVANAYRECATGHCTGEAKQWKDWNERKGVWKASAQ